jgi:hypothetical protein
MTKNTAPQQKMANGRYEDTNYRYSDKFIKRMTTLLIVPIFAGPAIGFALGALGDVFFDNSNYGYETPGWYTAIAISFLIGGIALPLAVGAWLGATALNKYAGPVGLLLVFGIGAAAAGSTIADSVMWTWIGIGAMVLSVLLFFYVGLQAKVPIWLQLPILQSPRVYLTKDKKSNDDPRNVKNIFK